MTIRRRQLWKICGETSIWSNYPTKPTPDNKLSILFVIETEDVTKYEFVCSSFNHNGTKLATMDQRGNIHEFDFKTFKCQTVSRCGISGDSITYSPKYNDITVALNNKEIQIFECGQYKLRAKIKTRHKHSISQLQYSFINNDKPLLMSCSSDVIILWDINNNYQQLQSLSHNYSIIFGLISPLSEAIVTCFENDMISFWDWTDYALKYDLFYSNKEILKKTIGHRHLKLMCGDINNKNGLLIVGGRGRYIYLWIIKKKLLLKCIVLPITIKNVIQLKFLENHASNIILILGDDGQIVAINHVTLNIEFYIQRSSQFIRSFAIPKHNKKISCTMSDGTIEIMSIKSLCNQYKTFECASKYLQPSKLSSLKLQIQTKNIGNTKTMISCLLSVDKLKNYLSSNGCYADKYRLIIWRFLLNLPNLQSVYTYYQQKGNNKEWQYKLNETNMRSKQRLLPILSLLSNWCNLCQHISFLPSFILPFTTLYKKNDIECFECIMFILCIYCSEWFVNYPDPSISILSFWISTLQHFDDSLYQHFVHHSISIEHYLWRILCNGFSSFFNETDWLYLWDHIITNTPLFLHILPISIVVCCRNTLFPIHNRDNIKTFFHHKQQIYIKHIIDKTYFMMKHLPSSLIPTFECITNPIERGKEMKHYPIFNRYPVESLAVMQQSFLTKLENKQDDEEHDKLLKALQTESEQITAKQTQFAQQQQMMDYLYKQRVATLQFEEEQHALKQKQKTDEITQKRLESLGNIQKTMNEMLEQQNTIKRLRIHDIDNQLIHHKKISKIQHQRLKNTSALNQLEEDIQSKLYSIDLEQSIKAQTLKLQRLKQEFDKEQKLKQRLLEQTLKRNDDSSKYKFRKQNELLSKMNKLQNQHETEQEIKHKLKLQSIINDERNKDIQQQNEITDLMNQQFNVKKYMIKKQNQLQNIIKNQEEFETNVMTDKYNQFKETIKQKHHNVLETHKNELLTKLNEHQFKLNKLSKQQRLKQFQTLLKDQQNIIKSNVSDKDQQLEETIDLLKNEIKNLHQKQTELELTQQEVMEENAFERIAKDAETQIINEEKQKYANVRQEMLKEMQKKEQRLRRKHKAMMHKLMKEREKQLLSIGQNAKDNVSHQEINELERQYQLKKEELKSLEDSYNTTQEQIKHQIFE